MRDPLELQGASLREFGVGIQRHVVEELPQHTVAEAVVVQIDL